MPPLLPRTVIVKPVSSRCNLRCSYCYNGVDFREHNHIPQMTLEVAEILHKSLLNFDEKFIKLIWHGGEPLLRGIDFYKSIIGIQQKLIAEFPQIHFENSVMSNGTLVTDEWVSFFAENKWRLGISIDGPPQIHNKFRVDVKQMGSFERAISGKILAEKAGISPGMIAVITSETVKYPPEQVYSFLKSIATGFDLSPCWEASCDGVKPEYSVEPSQFSKFMCDIFDLWWMEDDPQMNIRLFKNLLHGVLGGRPSNCAFNGSCAKFIAVDADGSVYPCGKFAGIQEFHLGNILYEPLNEIIKGEKYLSYLNKAYDIPMKCKECKWLKACHNGCTYDKYRGNGEFDEFTPFCETWKTILEHIECRVQETVNSKKSLVQT